MKTTKKTTKKFNAQLFGRMRPPLYKLEEVMEVVNKIAGIDTQVNELMIQRELYVKDLKQKIKETADTENKD